MGRTRWEKTSLGTPVTTSALCMGGRPARTQRAGERPAAVARPLDAERGAPRRSSTDSGGRAGPLQPCAPPSNADSGSRGGRTSRPRPANAGKKPASERYRGWSFPSEFMTPSETGRSHGRRCASPSCGARAKLAGMNPDAVSSPKSAFRRLWRSSARSRRGDKGTCAGHRRPHDPERRARWRELLGYGIYHRGIRAWGEPAGKKPASVPALPRAAEGPTLSHGSRGTRSWASKR